MFASSVHAYSSTVSPASSFMSPDATERVIPGAVMSVPRIVWPARALEISLNIRPPAQQIETDEENWK